MFIQNRTYVNLLLFLHCASRLEHVGLNKYFWHRAYLQSYNDVFHNASYSTGRGRWGQHFSTLRAPKLMTHWAPRVFDLLDTPLLEIKIRWIFTLRSGQLLTWCFIKLVFGLWGCVWLCTFSTLVCAYNVYLYSILSCLL